MKHTASAILIKNKKILLTKRSQNVSMFPGYWTIPGGRGEDGETPEEAVIREVFEEVGLKFIPTELFQSSLIEHSGERGRQNAFLVPIRAIFVFMKMSVMDMVGLRTLKHWYFRLLLIIEMLSNFSLKEIFSKKRPVWVFFI